MDAGKIIKKVRIKEGLTQKDVAKIMTVGQPYISLIETGKENPSPMFIKLFCLYFLVNEGLFNEN